MATKKKKRAPARRRPAAKKRTAKRSTRRATKKRVTVNPANVRDVKGSTGWIAASAVRIVKRGGRQVVLYKKARRK